MIDTFFYVGFILLFLSVAMFIGYKMHKRHIKYSKGDFFSNQVSGILTFEVNDSKKVIIDHLKLKNINDTLIYDLIIENASDYYIKVNGITRYHNKRGMLSITYRIQIEELEGRCILKVSPINKAQLVMGNVYYCELPEFFYKKLGASAM